MEAVRCFCCKHCCQIGWFSLVKFASKRAGWHNLGGFGISLTVFTQYIKILLRQLRAVRGGTWGTTTLLHLFMSNNKCVPKSVLLIQFLCIVLIFIVSQTCIFCRFIVQLQCRLWGEAEHRAFDFALLVFCVCWWYNTLL